jgi:hypothetical protein
VIAPSESDSSNGSEASDESYEYEAELVIVDGRQCWKFIRNAANKRPQSRS